ncbi:hypothetical protein J6590_000292 [Homalodisca vitripennis]|nr:hypothetical protein J6590_000292 [Homalodisca vitripennis]
MDQSSLGVEIFTLNDALSNLKVQGIQTAKPVPVFSVIVESGCNRLRYHKDRLDASSQMAEVQGYAGNVAGISPITDRPGRMRKCRHCLQRAQRTTKREVKHLTSVGKLRRKKDIHC